MLFSKKPCHKSTYEVLSIENVTGTVIRYMSEFKFYCHVCSQKLAATVEMVGVMVECPSCHTHMPVPPVPINPEISSGVDAEQHTAPSEASNDSGTTMNIDINSMLGSDPESTPTVVMPSSVVLTGASPASDAPIAPASDSGACTGCGNTLVVDAVGTCIFCGLNSKTGKKIAGA